MADKAALPTDAGTRPELFLTNSLTRRKERFEPIDPGNVRIYVCGPTVWDLAHLGNARAIVVFDVLVRLLRALYPRVTYVRNITDIDDKINARAAESGRADRRDHRGAPRPIFHADMAALGVLPPDVEPRATGHVAEMIELIGRLIASGHAYAAEGHALFAVASFPQYGRLSGRSPDELLAGARIDVAPYKRDPGDFVLWKPSTPDQPGWESPWGRGRPGWHIECSAMSWRYLGETFDIHGGGRDLIFPHHENELAQSLCALPGSHFARMWVHNGMLLVNGEKMSKSLGNFLTVRDVLGRAPAEAIRLLLLRAQYRAELDFSDAGLAEARRELDRFYRALERYPGAPEGAAPESVMRAMCDDMNTPGAIAALHALADAAFAGDARAAAGLREAGDLLGVLQLDPEQWFRSDVSVLAQTGSLTIAGYPPTVSVEDDRAAIQAAIDERNAARKARDFARADAIRAELAARGVVLEDGPGGTTWRRAS